MVEKLIVKSLQGVIDGSEDIDIAIGDVKNFLLNTKESSKYLPVFRALHSLRDDKLMDFCGHLRQCMMYFTCGFNITGEIYNKLFAYKDIFGFIFSDHNGYSVNIKSEIAPEISNVRSSYTFEPRRTNTPTTGDGRLYRYYSYQTYTSLSQKMLMYMISNMEKNETMLACLPTGGGKSLSWQLPAVSQSYQGMIIVVVPTIALAIDHERTSTKVFDNNFGLESYPLAYYSGIEPSKKRKIYDEVEAGTLPILYISPEALLNKEFNNKIISAARNGKVSALIIDEAHLIVNWGIRFRPEFQLLSSFRNQLQNESTNGLKTILLSATLTPEDTKIIRNIFDTEVFTEFRADELRAEPTYYAHRCSSEDERIDIIKHLVSEAPKPTIVYAAAPDEGKKIYDALSRMGYKNLALFTGQTANQDRVNIIEEWNENKIDIIVATSAFGMGVDKADVRTVITAYTPESISRYYQEVGRAGRDGFASLNYLLTYDEIDKEYVKSLTKGTVLTVDSLVNRWKELLLESEKVTPDTVWIDVNVPPEHLRYTTTGKRNAGWNKDVILLIYRAGLIEIIDVQNKNSEDYKILVKLKYIDILENPDRLQQYIEGFREEERDRINDGIISVKNLIGNAEKNCYSLTFVNEFPYVAELCNGCPYCRKYDFDPYVNKRRMIINSTKQGLFNYSLNPKGSKITPFLVASRTLLFSLSEKCSDFLLIKAIEFLVSNSVNIIIVPPISDLEKLMQTLAYYNNYKYMILTLEEAEQIDISWLGGVCGVFYTDNEDYNHELYVYSLEYLNSNENNKVIHIAQNEQFIKSEMRPLSEITDHNLTGEQYFLSGGITL